LSFATTARELQNRPCGQGQEQAQDPASCGPRLSVRMHRANEEREQRSLISLRVATAYHST